MADSKSEFYTKMRTYYLDTPVRAPYTAEKNGINLYRNN